MASSQPDVKWQECCGAFLFTVVGGFLDAYAYIAHGGVFANAQTGNIVLLAVNISQAEWTKALGHLLPILTFTTAALTVSLLNHRWKEHTTRLRLWSAAVEGGVLSVILVLQNGLPNSYVVPMISFAVAVQITSFGSIKDMSFNSGMTTGNLRQAITALSRMLTDKEPEKNRKTFLMLGTVCLCFLLGALVGSTITKHHPAHCLVVPLVFIAAAAVLSRVPDPRT